MHYWCPIAFTVWLGSMRGNWPVQSTKIFLDTWETWLTKTGNTSELSSICWVCILVMFELLCYWPNGAKWHCGSQVLASESLCKGSSTHSLGSPTVPYLSPSTCSGNTLGDTAFSQCPVISSLSRICPCHLNVLQILYHRVTPGLLGLPDPLLPSFGNHVNAQHGVHLSFILCTCPNHCSLIFLRMTSILSILALLISDFFSPCDSHFPTLPFVVCSLRSIFTTLMVRVSAPYRSVDRTSASYNHVLVLMPSLLFFPNIIESSKHRICLSNSCNYILLTSTRDSYNTSQVSEIFNSLSTYWYAITWLAFSNGFYCANSASAVLGVVILFVRPSVCPSVTRMLCD